jgi:hypothetical protein
MGQQPCKTLHRKQASASSSGLGDKAKNKMVGKVMRDSWSSLSFPFKDTVFPPLAASLLRLSLSLSLCPLTRLNTGTQAHKHIRTRASSKNLGVSRGGPGLHRCIPLSSFSPVKKMMTGCQRLHVVVVEAETRARTMASSASH